MVKELKVFSLELMLKELYFAWLPRFSNVRELTLDLEVLISSGQIAYPLSLSKLILKNYSPRQKFMLNFEKKIPYLMFE